MFNRFFFVFIAALIAMPAHAGWLNGTVCREKAATTSQLFGAAVTRVKCVDRVAGTCDSWGYQPVLLPTGYEKQVLVCQKGRFTGMRSNAPAAYVQHRPRRTDCTRHRGEFECTTAPTRHQAARELAVAASEPVPAAEPRYKREASPLAMKGSSTASSPEAKSTPQERAAERERLERRHSVMLDKMRAQELGLEALRDIRAGQSDGSADALETEQTIRETEQRIEALQLAIRSVQDQIAAL